MLGVHGVNVRHDLDLVSAYHSVWVHDFVYPARNFVLVHSFLDSILLSFFIKLLKLVLELIPREKREEVIRNFVPLDFLLLLLLNVVNKLEELFAHHVEAAVAQVGSYLD